MKRAKTKHATDPIFAVLERHRQKFAQTIEQHDEEKLARADALVLDQEYLLATTMPTTMAGVVALVEYVANHEADGMSEFACVRRVRGFRGELPVDWSRAFHRTLARALSQIAA
jgi:hypothetical protein